MVGRNQSLNKAHKGIWGLNIVLVQIDEPDDIRKFIHMLVALINVMIEPLVRLLSLFALSTILRVLPFPFAPIISSSISCPP